MKTQDFASMYTKRKRELGVLGYAYLNGMKNCIYTLISINGQLQLAKCTNHSYLMNKLEEVKWKMQMTLIKNTNEIKYGDIILGIPKQFLFSEESEIYLRPEDKCFKINMMRDDILSFSEEIRIAKCIMIDEINNCIYLVDMKNKNTFTWDINTTATNDNYSSWILDLNF